ncbi:Uncharacterised protein [Mycoplasmopsis synoviae]|uniref:Uncharacterized protein n=1 Tax=Mycoplasmopsis synoviae TaxID=2109 RepID=A0A3B0P5I7_MYCSY|nr:Uncharacterised protein [Mycoplasmopsis synoviae]
MRKVVRLKNKLRAEARKEKVRKEQLKLKRKADNN